MNSKPPAVPPAPQPRIWTTLDLLNWTKTFFEKKGLEHSRLEAELLLAEVLGCARIRLYVDFEKPIPAEQLAKYRDYVKRRGENREPLQYILGHTQFIDLKLKVTPVALIPRPETEILAAWAVDRAKEYASGARVLDLCTGTGCVALYIAAKVPDATVVATDLSEDALGLAAENAALLKLTDRVKFLQGDLFAALNDFTHEPFDLIVANPPYIEESAKAGLQPEVRDYEPAAALFAGPDGQAILQRILNECTAWLKPGGRLGLEFGVGQSESLKASGAATGIFDEILIEKDGAKLPRFLLAKRS